MPRLKDEETIQIITEGVRDWAEDYSKEYPESCCDDLCGLCAIAAAKLCYELRSNGYDAVIAFSSVGYMTYHAFVILDDHIIDITATQFQQQSVVIKPISEAENNYYWRVYKVFTTTGEFIKYLTKIAWCPEQMPNESLLEGVKIEMV